MRISSKFECGNGKNIRKVKEDYYRFTVSGDSPDYEDYFHIKVQGERDNESAILEVFPDPEITKGYDLAYAWPGKGSGIWLYDQMAKDLILIDRNFFDPKGSPIWVKHEANFWCALPPELYDTSTGTIKIRLKLNKGETIYLSSWIPIPYSEMSDWVKKLAKNYDILSVNSIGESVQGREIWQLTITSDKNKIKDKPTILIASGGHATEFSGVWAVKGIISYLISENKLAKWILNNYIVYIIPQMNPDGNVLGRPEFNAEGLDVPMSFGIVAGAEESPYWRNIMYKQKKTFAYEAKIIWNWVKKIQPYLYIEFHGWRTCIFGHEPYEGASTMNDDLYIDDARKKIKLILDNEIKTKTHGTSCFGVLQCGLENVHSLGYQLTKNFQTLSYGYEPNMRVGAEGCMERGVQVLKVLLNGIEIFRKRYS